MGVRYGFGIVSLLVLDFHVLNFRSSFIACSEKESCLYHLVSVFLTHFLWLLRVGWFID